MEDAVFFKWFRRLLLVIFIGILVLFFTGGIKINIGNHLIGRFSDYEAAGRYHGYIIEEDNIIGSREFSDGSLLIYTRFVSGMPENHLLVCVDFVDKRFYGYEFSTGSQMTFVKDEEVSYINYGYFGDCGDGLIVSNSNSYIVVDGKELTLNYSERNGREVYYQRLSAFEMVDFKFVE